MATGSVVVNVIDVGQGQCTFVEVRDTTGKLTNALLFDCGSDSQSAMMETNLKYIAKAYASMAVPAFDAVFLSHSDADHTSKLKPLLDLIVKEGHIPQINKLFFAGAQSEYTKHDFNVLTWLVTPPEYLKKADLIPINTNGTDFDLVSGSFKSALWATPANDVIVYALIGNVQYTKPAGGWGPDDYVPRSNHGERMNRVSLVCALYYNGVRHVICGDATYATMAGANRAFAAYYLQNVAMLTLPHHGSRRTTLDVEKRKLPNANAVKGVMKFSDVVRGQSTTASAYLKHSHPSQQIINLFNVNAVATPIIKDNRLQGNRHAIVSYFDISMKYVNNTSVVTNYLSYESDMNAFSTTYAPVLTGYTGFSYNPKANPHQVGPMTTWVLPVLPPAFNPGACWVFTISAAAANKWSMLGAASLPATTGPTGTVFTTSLVALVACRSVLTDPTYAAPLSAQNDIETDSATHERMSPALARPITPFRPIAPAAPLAALGTRAPSLARMRVVR